MFRARHIAVVVVVPVLAVLGATASGGPRPHPPGAAAQAYARQDPSGARQDFVSVEGDGDTAGDDTRVSAATVRGKGSAAASVQVKDVDIFDGLVRAAEVRVRAAADADGTSTSGSVSALVIDGVATEAPAGRTSYDMAGYGRLVALDSGSKAVLGLRARLTRDYKTYKAGDVIRVAYASAKARDAVNAPPVATPRQAEPSVKKKARKKAKRKRRHKLTAREKLERAVTERQQAESDALLAAPGYAFPIAGRHNFSDDYGAPRQDTGTHVGNDIFAAFGTPIVAVADGRLYRVGTRKVPGNRLWLRDHNGHRFFYAHLSDFAAAAYNGADVHAGEVIGFVGSTGDAEPTPPHLHFEVHLADRSPVNPFAFLTKWDASGAGTAKWVRRYGKDPGVRPGALVVVKDFLAEP